MARNEIKKEHGLNSFWIRIIAIAAMVWSFISASEKFNMKNSALSDCMMWFSYTLFAFLLVEGVNKTTNRLLYLRRFAVFTMLSEVAYDLYKFGTPYEPSKQSIMFTLCICLGLLLILDYFKRRFRNTVLDIILILALSVAAMNITRFVHSDFGKYGIMIPVVFYCSYDLSYPKIFEFTVMAAYSFYAKIDTIISISINGLQYTVPITIFAILALFVTWFYNEKRGPNALWLKIVFYLVYPICLLVFFFLENLN